jgi:hypothetical protein
VLEDQLSRLDYKLFYERHLPHYQPPGATMFITFRLADSLPAAVMQGLIEEARGTDLALRRIQDPDERDCQADLESRRLFGKWDLLLDTNRTGPDYL